MVSNVQHLEVVKERYLEEVVFLSLDLMWEFQILRLGLNIRNSVNTVKLCTKS